MTANELLDFVENALQQALTDVRTHLNNKPLEALQQRPHPTAWNALECLAHLNAYAHDYLPPLHRAIHLAKARQWAPTPEVRYTGAGKRLLRQVALDRPFKSQKRYDTFALSLDRDTVKSFLIYHEQLLRVVREARSVNLNRCRVKKPRSWFARYTLGNTLEFLARHAARHVAQALRAAGD